MLSIASTPRDEIRSLSKGTWLILATVFWVFGAIAWLLLGRPGGRLELIHRDAAWQARPGPAAALRRHPAGRAAQAGYGPAGGAPGGGQGTARPKGPDDDEGFLLALERQIRQARDDW